MKWKPHTGEQIARQKATNCARHRRHMIEVTRIKRAAKDVPCADCGKRYPYYVMDFDHKPGTKRYTLGYARQGMSPNTVLREIKKCTVVCSNCHREREHRRGNL